VAGSRGVLPRVALAALFAVDFGWLGATVSNAPPGPLDRAAAALLGQGVGPALFFTGAGRFPVFAVLCVLLLIAGVVWGKWRIPAGIAVGTLLVTWKVSDLFKDFYHRPRPEHWIAIHETSASYPSGHAVLALTFYGLIAYALWRGLPPSLGRSAVPVVAALWILATGWSRLALGAHYASDVLGGYLLGGAILLLVSLLLDRVWSPERGATSVAGKSAREVLVRNGSPP
jgi:undecaprenyl-diphosphatase